MKLAISNIAWQAGDDRKVYKLMTQFGYTGLEIAPTRIFANHPYEHLKEACEWRDDIKKDYGFLVPSMQSIWYGRKEKIFGIEEERQTLIAYTKKAVNFAAAIGCKNLVFGCPKNRNLPEGTKSDNAILFFKELGDYAIEHSTVIGMEANPPIYNTNYINDTVSALKLIKEVNSKGFLLNLDIGTMIQNGESVSELEGNVNLINHVHISEPGLKPIEERQLHRNLHHLLVTEKYKGYISIEMGKIDDIAIIEDKLKYVGRIFS